MIETKIYMVAAHFEDGTEMMTLVASHAAPVPEVAVAHVIANYYVTTGSRLKLRGVAVQEASEAMFRAGLEVFEENAKRRVAESTKVAPFHLLTPDTTNWCRSDRREAEHASRIADITAIADSISRMPPCPTPDDPDAA